MIKVSAGTACVLGLSKIRMQAPPTTAYFMIGEKCENNCSFCSQAKNSSSDVNMLSRVEWSKYDEENVFTRLDEAFSKGELKRACLQVVNSKDSSLQTISAIKQIKKHSDIPICSSAELSDEDAVKSFLECGADKLCISIDAVTPKLFKEIKGKDFEMRLNLLLESAKKYPGKLTSHVIVGLGETEKEMIEFISKLSLNNITVALFAFTPLKGTEMESREKPDISTYRRIQIANFLLHQKMASLENFKYTHDKLSEIYIPYKEYINNSFGLAFRTTGCADCNRPYYNESPGGVIYNYPKALTDEQVLKCLQESELR